MVRITDRDLELTVINVNRTEVEHVFGVDLVYYDHIRDKAVAVQYKRLEWNTSMTAFRKGPEWIYWRKSDWEDQLEKMEPHTFPHSTSADDWRLSSSPNFFKFVHQDFGGRSSSLLPGMYVPADYNPTAAMPTTTTTETARARILAHRKGLCRMRNLTVIAA